MENKVKVGDKFVAMPEWDYHLGIGVVIEVNPQGRMFALLFDGNDERGPFYTHEIGRLVRRLTPLEELL